MVERRRHPLDTRRLRPGAGVAALRTPAQVDENNDAANSGVSPGAARVAGIERLLGPAAASAAATGCVSRSFGPGGGSVCNSQPSVCCLPLAPENKSILRGSAAAHPGPQV